METKNQLPFDEVVDSLADLFEVVEVVEEQLKDGFQFTDTFAVIQIYPKLQEVYNDRKKFVAQFIDLTPEESDQVVKALAERVNADETVLKQKVLKVFYLTSQTYGFLSNTVTGGKSLAGQWASFFDNNPN